MLERYRQMAHEVERLLKAGYTQRQIVKQLGISCRTYKHVLEYLGYSNTKGHRGYQYLKRFHSDAFGTVLRLYAGGRRDEAMEILASIFRPVSRRTLSRWLGRAKREGVL